MIVCVYAIMAGDLFPEFEIVCVTLPGFVGGGDETPNQMMCI